jgi:uncharacterized membrane protein YfcA
VNIALASSSGDLGVLALGLVIAGVVCGIASGILGIGGGIVLVPILYHVLATLGVDENIRMQLAVGTSLAATIPASYASAVAQNRNDAIDWDLFRRWAMPMLVGVAAGGALSGLASGRTLTVVFAIVAIPIALHLAFGRKRFNLGVNPPRGPVGLVLPSLIGGASVMTGADGATIGAPAMTAFGVPVSRALGTASLFSAIITVPGTIGAIVAGWNAHGLPPYSLGFVSLPAFALIAPSAFLAPFGASIAEQVNAKRMRPVFAVFIVIVAGRMLWDAFL